MILFFDIIDYTNSNFIGCGNKDYRYNGDWENIKATADATRSSFILNVNSYLLAFMDELPSGCTLPTSDFEIVTGLTNDIRYSTFWLKANSPNQMQGLTAQINSDYIDCINEYMCALRRVMYYFDNDTFEPYWEYPNEYKEVSEVECCTGYTRETKCGDNCIPFSAMVTTDLTEINSVEEFSNVLYTELIDAKNRQSISAYPTLRALYDRYNFYPLAFSDNQSSQFDYFDMDNFGQSVGGYWVDLIEQVVPATTIWESTYVYRNTVFDQQKYAYKRNNIYNTREVGKFPLEPIASDCDVEIITEVLGGVKGVAAAQAEEAPIAEDSIKTELSRSRDVVTKSNCVWTMQWTCSPEFLGTVKVLTLKGLESVGPEVAVFHS